MDARTGGHGFELFVAETAHVEHYLEVFDSGAVVESHKLHMLVASAGAYPAHHIDFFADELRIEYLGNSGSFHW